MNGLQQVLIAVLPSAGVLGIFIFVMRQIMRADRKEREAIARFEAAQAGSEDSAT